MVAVLVDMAQIMPAVVEVKMAVLVDQVVVVDQVIQEDQQVLSNLVEPGEQEIHLLLVQHKDMLADMQQITFQVVAAVVAALRQ